MGVMSATTTELCEALAKYCHPHSIPVGVKLAKAGQEIQQKAKFPLKDIGNRLAVCQGMTIARTIGWTMAFRKEDQACPLGSVILGYIKPDSFLKGKISGYYQDQEDCSKKMEAAYPRLPLNSIEQIWLSPLRKCEFEPDLAVVYGNPGQMITLITAANFRHGPGIKSLSSGRGGCSTWIAGVSQADECTYMIPGVGERVFGGTQDFEMSFAVPYSKFEHLIEGLRFIRKQGAFRYPVPNLAILNEPKMPKEYYTLDPDRQRGPEEAD
jgi:uncharacterized protein (DUF169 family)